MGLTTENIKDIIDFCKTQQVSVRVRDIAYILLSSDQMEPQMAYQCLFGADGYDDYKDSRDVAITKDYMMRQGYMKQPERESQKTEGITFEENKKELESMIERIEQKMSAGLIDPKDGFNIIKDIRVKLNDKFKMERQNVERTIIVEKKYNAICKCGREIAIPTLEELKEKYNLVEKTE